MYNLLFKYSLNINYKFPRACVLLWVLVYINYMPYKMSKYCMVQTTYNELAL